MSLKQAFMNIQRLLLIGIEALLVIVTVQMMWAFWAGHGLHFVQHAFIFGMMLLSGFPLFFMYEKSHTQIWLGTAAVLWIVVGIVIGFDWYVVWFPALLGLWRSTSSVMVTDYIIKTVYKRVILLGVLMGLYIFGSHFAGNEMWAGTTSVGWLMFTFTIAAMIAAWFHDQLEEDGFEWKRAFKTQGLLAVLIGAGIGLFVLLVGNFNNVANAVTFGLNRLVYYIMYPIMKLFEFVLPYLKRDRKAVDQEVRTGSNKIEELVYDGPESFIMLYQIIKWGIIVISVAAVIYVIYIILRRYFSETLSEESNTNLVETRAAAVLEQTKTPSFFDRVRNWFERDEKDEIRLLYLRFLRSYVKLSKQDDISKATTREIMAQAGKIAADHSQLQTLTSLYEERRYGQKEHNQGIIERMKNAVTSWYRK